MTVETGALEQAYALVETGYMPASPAALSATDGIRHLALALNHKHNRENSPAKRGTPDYIDTLPRRRTTTWNLSQIMWEPSGTPGTISNVGKFIKAGFGSNHVVSGGLSTDVSGATSATVFEVTSATGLQVGDLIAVEVGTAGSGVFEVTRITAINTLELTVEALSGTPDVGAAVVAGITYTPTSLLTESLAIYKYFNAGGYKQAAYGAIVDQLQFTFDGTREVMLAMQGPAGDFADSDFGTVQAKPASHTTVGSPVGGMTGSFYVAGSAFLTSRVVFNFNNRYLLRNNELGTSKATGLLARTDMREVTAQVTFWLEDRNLMSKANNIVRGQLRLLVGSAAGSMLAAFAKSVEFEFPDIPDGTGPIEITVEGKCLGTAGNDSLVVAEI